jgi:hypothetical protein
LTLGLGALAIGFVTGLVFGRHSSADSKKQEETEQRLQETESTLNQYRDEVTSHFRQTADLVNRLTNDYRAVHQHLAEGAQRLCTQPPEGEQKLLEPLAERSPLTEDAPDESETAEPAMTAQDAGDADAGEPDTKGDEAQGPVSAEAESATDETAADDDTDKRQASTAAATDEPPASAGQQDAAGADEEPAEPTKAEAEPAKAEKADELELDEDAELRPPLDYVPAGLKAKEDGVEKATTEDELKPPLDYAPRRNPKDGGVLREDYGLEKTGS